MSASDNLSEALFHASGADLKIGSVIKPTKKYRVAHATTSLKYATDFGEGLTHPGAHREGQIPMFGTVYTVEPVDAEEVSKETETETNIRKQEKNPEVPAESHMRFSKKGFRVTGVRRITNNYASWGRFSHEDRYKKD